MTFTQHDLSTIAMLDNYSNVCDHHGLTSWLFLETLLSLFRKIDWVDYMACGSMIKSGIKQTVATKAVESSSCFSLNSFHKTKQGSIIPQFMCPPLSTLSY